MVQIFEAVFLCGVVSLAVLKSDTFAGIWGFPKMVVPKNQGFPTKNDHFGVFWGYHHLRKHPYSKTTHQTLKENTS